MTEPELLSKLSGIEHFLCDGQAYWLYQKAFELPDDANILEIGCYHGCSTAAMALGCVGTAKHIYVVDVNREYLQTAQEHWSRLDVDRYIRSMAIDSESIMRIATVWEWPRFDFAFIDGEHRGAVPLRDFKNVVRLMKTRGRIAMHDVIDAWPDVKETWRKWALPRLRKFEYCGSIASGEA